MKEKGEEKKARKKKAMFDESLVKEANEKVKAKIESSKPVPINMFEFNNYWAHLRSEEGAVRLDYLKSIPLPQLKKIFKTSEINPTNFH